MGSLCEVLDHWPLHAKVMSNMSEGEGKGDVGRDTQFEYP